MNRSLCPHCRKRLDPGERIHEACIEPYAQACGEKAKRKGAKKAKETARAERESVRQRKQALKRIPDLIAEAQVAFNAFIRARDKDKGCFVCGKPFPENRPGGSFDAGHVRSRGAAGHLRFHELNCHGECKECNSSFGAKPHEIKAGAIARIGIDAYETLENDNTPHKWERDELIEIAKKYKAKQKEFMG